MSFAKSKYPADLFLRVNKASEFETYDRNKPMWLIEESPRLINVSPSEQRYKAFEAACTDRMMDWSQLLIRNIQPISWKLPPFPTCVYPYSAHFVCLMHCKSTIYMQQLEKDKDEHKGHRTDPPYELYATHPESLNYLRLERRGVFLC